MNNNIKVMLVEDSPMIRKHVSRAINAKEGLEVSFEAENGLAAIDALKTHDIDVIILDIEMPEMDGLTALPELLKIKQRIPIIMASTLTTKGASVTIKALTLGAVDYVAKPSTDVNTETFLNDLIEKITQHSKKKVSSLVLSNEQSFIIPKKKYSRPRALAIGCSTGGPNALQQVLKDAHEWCRFPIFITQHMPENFTKILAERLASHSGLEAKEGEDGETVKDKTIYVAPGGYHMCLSNDRINPKISLNQNPPENFCRPAADPMFRSLSDTYKSSLMLMVLTGLGYDGKKGAKYAYENGARVIAQSTETCVIASMPKGIIEEKICSDIVPLSQFKDFLKKECV